MDFLHLKIDSKISKDSLEYKSLIDENKNRNIKELTLQYINNNPQNWGGAARKSIRNNRI
ncbi:hypothetical protein [Helicobacter sp. MIT 99-5507]|uniref:hypothetical protein n=1 Tax=Helicobacter sp. MIT 99-5507 TaxID=152489 RepID=UPI000E1F8603|nr:hypothetical protein [Helicobacter sp. MIT 99-5507]RDU58461.1 hypothetical protein CQA42_01335 [Helicobacter sp. MIT 99-5507]